MKVFATALLGFACSGCATYSGNGFTCLAAKDDCNQYLRTGGAPVTESRSYSVPDQESKTIYTNRGPIYIFRQGNTYWVNDRRR